MKRSKKTSDDQGHSVMDVPHPVESLLVHLSDEDVDPFDTRRERAWLCSTRQMIGARLAELRRQHTPARAAVRQLARVSDELHGLDRVGLLTRLSRLSSQPNVQIAHLELSALTDEDLRQTIAEIENIERSQG